MAFAERLLSSVDDVLDANRVAQATETLSEVSKLLAPYYDSDNATTATTPPLLQRVSDKRWGAASTCQSLEAQHDCIALPPWRLSICGDFIRSMSRYAAPSEAAALSGLEAGERTVAFLLLLDSHDGDDETS